MAIITITPNEDQSGLQLISPPNSGYCHYSTGNTGPFRERQKGKLSQGNIVTSEPINDNTYVGLADKYARQGYTSVSNEPIPLGKPQRLQEMIKRRLKKETFEALKAKGVIVVNPLKRVDIVVDDALVIKTSGTTRQTTRPYFATRSSFVGRHGTCGPGLSVYSYPEIPEVPFAATRGNADGSGVLPLYCTVVRAGTYSATRLSDRINLLSIAEAIRDSLDRTPLADGLVTANAGELSSAAWDILTELGELPETLKMIFSGLKAAITKYREVKGRIRVLERNRLNSGKSLGDPEHLTDIASLWMNYRYGVGPIAYSIQDALEYLNRKSSAYTTVRNGQDGEISLDVNGVTGTIPYRDRAWGKAEVSLANPTSHMGINVAKTAFELMPLSFVIGWFYNVGDLLASLSGPSGALQTKYTASRSCQVRVPLKYEDVTFHADVRYYNIYEVDPLSQIGLPLDVNITWKRALDALSLSWFAFRKSKN